MAALGVGTRLDVRVVFVRLFADFAVGDTLNLAVIFTIQLGPPFHVLLQVAKRAWKSSQTLCRGEQSDSLEKQLSFCIADV